MSRLDDTSACPVGTWCESCGSTDQPTIRTASTPVGVLCLTVCPRCAAAACIPTLPVASAVGLVLQHCAHLGIDADQMADAIDRQAHA